MTNYFTDDKITHKLPSPNVLFSQKNVIFFDFRYYLTIRRNLFRKSL
ncbi:hypothetical protein BACPLE_01373 [Phocaeicola plebeius DSM 17135]|uniref:Uncharacterized protein n=1 Tax=Phocaeicola plebeius (strain DSM 17135 / JCM 12973 / CCUG 54634 / M2) TaxID=484018 RepID=B5CXD2_PHOPM|nr:hypothetical protein BACPLE_01373 [Phocaeicola plebeius DSM 17135]